MTLIRKLCVDLGTGLEEADKLISNVTVTLTNAHSEREVREVMLAVTRSVHRLDCTNFYFLSFFFFVSWH